MNLSSCYWEQDWLEKSYDFGIIGAGIVGLSTALELRKKEPHARIIILEKLPMGAGASSRNAGFACFGSPTELLADMEIMGEEAVMDLVQMRWDGLQLLRAHVGDEVMDYREWGGYECFLPHQEKIREKAQEQLPRLNQLMKSKLGLDQVFQSVSLQPFGFSGLNTGFFNPYEGQIHPGKMYQQLEKKVKQAGVHILRGAAVEQFELGSPCRVYLGQQYPPVHCEKLIICTNGFTQQLLPELDCQPARAQVLLTEPIPNLALQGTFHMDEGYYYFRNVGNRILLGGARNFDFNAEANDTRKLNASIQEQLEKLLRENLLPQHKYSISHRWTGIMGVGKQKQPLLQDLGNNGYLAVRLGGMGVAIGCLLGNKVAHLCH